MLEARFDHIRKACLGAPRDGFFVMVTKADPDRHNVSLTYQLLPYEQDDTWRMLVMANYYGVTIATDSRLASPIEEPPEELFSIITFTASDLRVA
jgi:mannosyltransferase OCH1-like enzyme